MRAAPAAPENELSEWFYAHGYIVRHSEPSPVSLPDDPSMLANLAAANRGRAGWDAGWRVDFVHDDGSVVAARDSALRRFEPGAFVSRGIPGLRPEPGFPLAIYAPAEFRSSEESFYYVFGECVDPFGGSGQHMRIYWNVSAEGAAPLIDALTREFNRFQVPFQFKCVHRLKEFCRLDSAVLYVHPFYWEITSRLIPRVYDEVARWLAPGVPMLTKPLRPGLALAESPAGGGSFGQHRCRIVSRAARALLASPKASDDARIEELSRQFRNDGFDFSRPYLNPDSTDRYDLP
jgi:hypothetical protein